jgi:hypothetical protein
MLPMPFLSIPLDQYRLFMALISLPVTVSSWLGMAGIARLITRGFGKKTTFHQYLNLFAFSFFPFWFFAMLGDALFTLLTGPGLILGLQGAYGPVVQLFTKITRTCCIPFCLAWEPTRRRSMRKSCAGGRPR